MSTRSTHGANAEGSAAAPDAAQRLGVGDERDERDQVARLRAVDVAIGVRALTHPDVETQQVRLATSEHDAHVVLVDERLAAFEELVEELGGP